MRYLRPTTLEQAIAGIGEGGIPLAGGTVLVPELKHSAGENVTVVDIGRLAALREMKVQHDDVQIGAAVTLARLSAHADLQRYATALVEAAETVGNPQVRRAATVGGNIALGIPGADLIPALLVLDAEVMLFGTAGEELLLIEQIIKNGMPAGRLITGIKINFHESRRSRFRKFAWRLASGKTIVNVAAALRIENGRIMAPKLTAGGLSKHPSRLPLAENFLDGQAWSDSLIEQAARAAAAEVVVDVISPPAEKYRRKLVAAGLRQLLTEMSRS